MRKRLAIGGAVCLAAWCMMFCSTTRGEEQAQAAEGARAWRSVGGDTIEAEFVALKFGSVQLRTAEGGLVTIPLERLVEEDRAAARALAGSAAPAAPERKTPSFSNKQTTAKAPGEVSSVLTELFGSKLTDGSRKSVGVAELAGKEKIGIYFSAHWCPPCRAFTPKLVEAHNALRKGDKPFEVVFVSADRSERDMLTYMKEAKMPWLAMPFDAKERQSLTKKFNVSGIPRLVIIDANGKILSNNAVGAVGASGAAAYEQW